MIPLPVIFLLFYVFIVMVCQGAAGESIQVNVTQGELAGEVLTTASGLSYYSFKGVPFAQAPVGKLRFMAPEPPESWEGVRNATEHGAACPGYNIVTDVYTLDSEDCLFANVYSTNLTGSLPVMVYVFGGSFRFGSGDTDIYGPEYLISSGVVIVTFNYRLDALGFLSLENCEVPGNAGLMDQVAALEWVRDNIGYFGGDANNVTLVGGQSGGASVDYHLVSPRSAGLFKRAISMSGAPTCEWAYPFKPAQRAFRLGKLLGLETNNSTELLAFLQNVTFSELINTASYVMASETTIDIAMKMQPFTPVIEPVCSKGNFITKDPSELLKSGNVSNVDIMVGHNSKESLILISAYNSTYMDDFDTYIEMFTPADIYVNSSPNTILAVGKMAKEFYFGQNDVNITSMDALINITSAMGVEVPVQRFARNWPDCGKIYYYIFASNSSRNYYGKGGAAFGITGVSHFDEVFYLFNSTAITTTVEAGSTEDIIMQNFQNAVINFVKYGNPTPDASPVDWPEFNNSTNFAYVEFTGNLTVKYQPRQDQYGFWERAYAFANMTL